MRLLSVSDMQRKLENTLSYSVMFQDHVVPYLKSPPLSLCPNPGCLSLRSAFCQSMSTEFARSNLHFADQLHVQCRDGMKSLLMLRQA